MKAENRIDLNIDNKGKGRRFESRFLQAGLVKYSFGVCLLSKEVIDRFAYKFVGCPVIIDHKDITDENAKDERVGVISKVWYNEYDGWFWCEGVVFDDEAISLIKDKGYNVSCQYNIDDYTENTANALHNGNPYDITILDGTPEHLAIVKNPRYEEALIAVNKNDFVTDTDSNGEQYVYKVYDKETQNKINNIKPIVIDKSKVIDSKNKKDISKWVKEIFNEIGEITIKDTEHLVKLSNESADRETIKRRVKKEQNKSVYAEFENLVGDAIKVDDRKQDDRHDKDQEIYFNKFQLKNNDTEELETYGLDLIIDKPNESDKYYRYAGHKAYKIAPTDTTGAEPDRNGKGANNIVPHFEEKITSSNEIVKECNMKAENDKWIMIKPNGEDEKGRHLLLKDGETPKEAIDKQYGDKEEKKEPVKSNAVEDKIKEYESKIPKNYKRNKETKALWLYKNSYITRAEWENLRNMNEGNQLKLFNALEEQLERFVSLVAKNFDESKHDRDKDGKFTDSGNFSGESVDEQEAKLVKELKRLEKNGQDVSEIYKKLTGKEWNKKEDKKGNKPFTPKSQKSDSVKFDKIGKVLTSILKDAEKSYKESK